MRWDWARLIWTCGAGRFRINGGTGLGGRRGLGLAGMGRGSRISLLCWGITVLCGVFFSICLCGRRRLRSRLFRNCGFGFMWFIFYVRRGLRIDPTLKLVRRLGRSFRCMRRSPITSSLRFLCYIWRNPALERDCTFRMKIYNTPFRIPLTTSLSIFRSDTIFSTNSAKLSLKMPP